MTIQEKLKQLEDKQKFVRILAIDENNYYNIGVGLIDFDENQDDIIHTESNYTSKKTLHIKEIQSIEVMIEVWNKADDS